MKIQISKENKIFHSRENIVKRMRITLQSNTI